MKLPCKLRAVLGILLAAATARAATTPTPSLPPLALPPAAQAAFDEQLANTWAKLLPTIDAALVTEIQKQVGQSYSGLTINSLSIMSQDFTPPPVVAITQIVTPAGHPGEEVQALLPGPGTSWSIALGANVTYDLSVKILFFTVKKTITENVTLAISNLQATDEVELDTNDPTLPVCIQTGNVQLNYDLSVLTSTSVLNSILSLLRPVIDAVLAHYVDQALQNLDGLIAPLSGLPSATPWGAGGPALAPFSQQPDLQQAALAVDTEIQAYHVPFGTILSCTFSDTTYGQGTVTGYGGDADSAIWTGHYLAGEAFRFAVTKDAAAQANAAAAIAGIEDLLDAERPGGGHLSRCILPMSYPGAAAQLADPTWYTTTLHGLPYVAQDSISRDQYLGVMYGLGCAYDFLDDPGSRKLAGSLIIRVVEYLEGNGWVAMEHDNVTWSAPFIQSPDKMVAFAALAAHVDGRFRWVFDNVAPLAYIEWLGIWTGLIDPLDGYYGWNLGQGARYHQMRLVTNPDLYMAIERAHDMERRGIGHHENAYFQCTDAAVEPSLAATLSPEIVDELRRWTARPRRDFDTQNSTNPAIAQALYSVPLSFQKNPSGTGALVPVSRMEAEYPIPVDERTCTDFLWQRDPFQLDGGGDPHNEEAGVDMVLPYWMGRYYNLVP